MSEALLPEPTQSRLQPTGPLTIAALLQARASDDSVALRFEEQSWTWREVVSESRRRGELALARRGDGPWHIGVLLDNTPEFLFWLFGIGSIGATLVALNPTRRGAQLRGDIVSTDVQLIITETVHASLLDNIDLPFDAQQIINVNGAEYRDLLPVDADPTAAAAREAEVLESTIATLVFTSGTTSNPKAVICTNGRLIRLAIEQSRRRPFFHTDMFYVAMPMFHSNALMAAIAPALLLGAGIALRRKFSASGFIDDVRRFGATCFNYVGKPLHFILATHEQPDDAENPLRIVFGNEASAEDVHRFATRFDCEVQEQYGSSEGGVRIAPVAGQPTGSFGLANEGAVVMDSETGIECPPARFDANGLLLNADEAIGEIVSLTAAAEFEGYYKNPEATAARIRDGIMWTGDLAYRDEQGFWYFAGRTEDWLRVDGENIAAAPIERLIMRHPAISQAAVYAIPDSTTGDQVMAALELHADATFDSIEFGAFLRAQADLGTKWSPAYIRVMTRLPRTATNKVVKAGLRREGIHTGDAVFARQGRELLYAELEGAPSPSMHGVHQFASDTHQHH